MPANLTPEYKKADEWFRSATTDPERLTALEEMLRVIPKHKGTEHIQADIKRKISKIKESANAPHRGAAAKRVDMFQIPKSGGGQVALIGLPNCGKSSILAHLTNAKVNVTDYPFGTEKPVPGMMKHEDVPIEIVDTPPITAEYAAPGQVQVYRGCDLIGIVVDLSGDILDQMEVCLKYLREHRLLLEGEGLHADEAGQTLGHKALIIATQKDRADSEAAATLRELYGQTMPMVEISTVTAEGLLDLTRTVFQMLDIVRVYAKRPGHPPDMKDPFTLARGSSVTDLANRIHRELADKLKSARVWNSPVCHDGQNIPREHIVNDKEVIELHFA